MINFYMNGYPWSICYVDHDDSALNDISGHHTVATTDWDTCTIYISNNLSGEFKTKVLIHELGHCALFSFGLVDKIHQLVYPEYWIEAEERICNFLADYGKMIFDTAYKILGENAWVCIPKEFEKMIA